MERTIVSVSQLNKYVKSLLDSNSVLGGILVRGEISNFLRHYKSGHMYFTLKDKDSAVKSVMFRGHAENLKFLPENGMTVIASGSISLYERDGSYQLYVTDMQPNGIGALYLAFEQLKEKLSREGLFDKERKRAIPRYPESIGIVTSEGAAALQDILNILARRYPIARIILAQAQVQGVGSAATISAAIRRLNEANTCDVIIVGRGGGSIEDLWAFNDENLAREIASSKIPIVSAVGHETDFTISDFVSDLRAPTPSAAAELVTPNLEDVKHYLDDLAGSCLNSVEQMIFKYSRYIQTARARLATPKSVLQRYLQLIDAYKITLHMQIERSFDKEFGRLKYLEALVEERSPIRLLERGYSLTFSANGESVVSASQTRVGQKIITRLKDGEIVSTVLEIKEHQDG